MEHIAPGFEGYLEDISPLGITSLRKKEEPEQLLLKSRVGISVRFHRYRYCSETDTDISVLPKSYIGRYSVLADTDMPALLRSHLVIRTDMPTLFRSHLVICNSAPLEALFWCRWKNSPSEELFWKIVPLWNVELFPS